MVAQLSTGFIALPTETKFRITNPKKLKITHPAGKGFLGPLSIIATNRTPTPIDPKNCLEASVWSTSEVTLTNGSRINKAKMMMENILCFAVVVAIKK